MTTADLTTVLTVAAPLIVALIAAGVGVLWQWSSNATTTANKSSLLVSVENAVRSFVHTTLAQGQLLNYAQHGPAVVALVNQLAPGWPASITTPLIQAAMNAINSEILKVEAQRQTAAAATPTVIEPNADDVARLVVKTLVGLASPPVQDSPPPAATAVPVQPVPATGAPVGG